MYNRGSSGSTLTNCDFSENYAGAGGGGLVSNLCDRGVVVQSCAFMGNWAGDYGGGVYNYESGVLLTNCIFSANQSSSAPAVDNPYGGTAELTNCTVSKNRAKGDRNAISEGYEACTTTVANCILWGNTNDSGGGESAQVDSDVEVSFSCIEGWSSGGVGNINEPPQFVDANGPDNIAGTEDDDLRLLATSPCIDEGNNVELPADSLDLDGDGNTTEPIPYDLDGRARIFDGDFNSTKVVDMGAYEFYHEGVIIYVDELAEGAGDGTSWDDAYHFLQDGLRAALYGDEIRVAKGIYKPDSNSDDPGGSRDREATFQLKSGVVLKGGYAGFGEPNVEARDVRLYESILTGDLNQDDADVNDPCELLDEPTRAENAYHVVTGSGTDANAVLDGFIITAGNANDVSAGHTGGGGMYNSNFSSTVGNCIFRENSALGGGGVKTISSGGSLLNCAFIGNWAEAGGGGMANALSLPDLANCIFSGNATGADGGAVHNYRSSPDLTNCTLSCNRAENLGGGIYNGGGAIGSYPTIVNCILWGNSDSTGHGESAQIKDAVGSSEVKYSCIEGWSQGGVGNINEPPQFADANGPDDEAGTEDDNLRLGPNSPCIDEGNDLDVPGDVLTDLDGRVRIADGDCNFVNGMSVDMGAYEFAWIYIGDFDYDCDVDFADWGLFAMAWLTEQGEGGYIADYDISIPADNKIDWADVKIFCDNWLAGT
jgi:hypothetical protein